MGSNILLKKTLLKMTDSAYGLQAAAFRIFLHNHREAKKLQEKRDRILRGTCNKFANSAYRLGHAALKKLVAYWKKGNKSAEELARRKEGVLKRIIDVDARLMGMGLNRLKQQALAIYNLKRSFCLRIMDKNVQLMAAAQRNLRDHAYQLRHSEMKLKNKQEGIINRMMNANLRMMGGVLRYLKHINDEGKKQEA